jgi:hypothetical protein
MTSPQDSLKAGDEVRVRTPRGIVPGTVTYVGRKWISIRYNGRLGDFDMQTRRSRGQQIGAGTYYEVPDAAEDSRRSRIDAAVDVLDGAGIELRPGHYLTLEQIEAIAAILRPDPKPEEG